MEEKNEPQKQKENQKESPQNTTPYIISLLFIHRKTLYLASTAIILLLSLIIIKIKLTLPGSMLKRSQKKFLSEAIEKRLNRKVEKFEKIFDARYYEGSARLFHKICDKYNNTLVLVKTNQNRLFGGFTTQQWNGSNIYKNDDKAFTFSLDRSMIYDIKKLKKYYAIKCDENNGPIFGIGNDFFLYDDTVNSRRSWTNEAFYRSCSFDYNKFHYALSEDGFGNHFLLKNYEVYHVVLN